MRAALRSPLSGVAAGEQGRGPHSRGRGVGELGAAPWQGRSGGMPEGLRWGPAAGDILPEKK